MAKRSAKTLLTVTLSLILLLYTTAITAGAETIESYLESTQLKVTTYPLNEQLSPDESGSYNIPVYMQNLLISSIELRTSYSSSYTTTWSVPEYSKWISISQKSSYSSLLKINSRPTVEEGDQSVAILQTVKNKDGEIVAEKNYTVVVKHQLPVVELSVNVTDGSGNPIEARVTVATNVKLPTVQTPDGNGVYSVKAGYEYICTVEADGYKTFSKVFTVDESSTLDVILEAGYSVSFRIKRPNGSNTDYATLKVFDKNGKLCTPIQDEYGYDTYDYELCPGEYTYSASYSNDSEYAEGGFSVTDRSLEETIQLVERIYPIVFNVKPENAVIGLYKNTWKGPDLDNPILPDDEGKYNIKFGQYCYIVEADGYVKVQKTFNATDTKLKNDGYVITVALLSETEQLLKDAGDRLFRISGEGFAVNEFTGNLREIDDEPYFTPWDIDSNYDDTNVCGYIEQLLRKYDVKYSDIKVSVVSVKSDYDWRYNSEFEHIRSISDMPDDFRVISKNGDINYTAVNTAKIDEDYGGEVWCVYIRLSLGEYEQTVDTYFEFIVPEHICTRQERLCDIADEFGSFSAIKGMNNAADSVKRDLNLSFDFEDAYYYYIIGSWTSDNTAVISNDGKITRAERDTVVNLTLTVAYSDAQIEDGGFLMDPGPLGENSVSKTITVTVKGTGHKAGEYKCESEANCIYGGLMVQRCTLCGEILATYSTMPNGHSFTEWKTLANGSMLRSCESCGYEQRKTEAEEPSAPEESSEVEESSAPEESSQIEESSVAEESSEPEESSKEESSENISSAEESSESEESSVAEESSANSEASNSVESPSTADNGITALLIIAMLAACTAFSIRKIRS